MKKLWALALGLALVGTVAFAERRTKTISATATNTSVNLVAAVPAVSVYNAGGNGVYLRLFQEGESPAVATTADPSVFLPAGSSADFQMQVGEGRYFAVSAICAAAETATVYVYY